MNAPIDNNQRLAALDPLRSICVTAPAGSGKTELLSQRVLKLLAMADRPEEILAITFTRKAAAEMHHRIITALSDAKTAAPPEQPHKLLSWELAQAALNRDQHCGWNLLENTSRLKIQTIDSLCASLTRQMPILSNFGAQPQIAQNCEPYYRLAVEHFFQLLEQDNPLADDLCRLLNHVDNDMGRAERLLVMMLQRRDQWLMHIGMDTDSAAAKSTLEHTLQRVCLDVLQQLHTQLQPVAAELVPLLDYAGCNMQWQQADSIVTGLAGIMELPAVDIESMEPWRAIAELLLTKTHQWRKSVDKRSGFPAETRDGDKQLAKLLKNQFVEQLNALQPNEALLPLLVELRHLPAPHFDDRQWQLLDSLTRLLPGLVAQLILVFQQQGEVDYSQISMAALRALGEGTNPTELAMKLDYQLRHILVDEFQDTASTQFKLLERLVEGWAEHNASNPQRPNTLFIVGDGMQSIYGFREANVGLFLEARKQGVNGLRLADLPLKVNFRSDPAVVDWVNKTFARAFPAVENLARGAVPFAGAEPFNPPDPHSAIAVMGFSGEQARVQEAEQTVTLIQQAQQQNPGGSIAVLVRSRNHLRDIIPALTAAGISWNATDINPLASYGPIIDLLSLTRALFNIADRISWAALLRTPWIGLTNSDLHALLATAEHSLLTLLTDEQLLAERSHLLSRHGRQRLEKVRPILLAALENRYRYSARSWVEGVWLALGGAATLSHSDEFTAVDDFFDLLEAHQQGDLLGSLAEFETAVSTLYAAPAVVPSTLYLMTIHKAKGLEFDTVILPAMARSPRSDDRSLMMWREYLSPTGDSAGLVISPLGAIGDDDDPIYQYLRFEQAQTTALENTRLFYVAATRAISHLYVLFTTELDKKTGDPKPPAKNSLLSSAWPALEHSVSWPVISAPDTEQLGFNFDSAVQPLSLNRLAAEWQPPQWSFKNPLAGFYLDTEFSDQQNTLDLFEDRLPAQIGTVVHWILDMLAERGMDAWQRLEKQPWLESLLHYHQVPCQRWPEAIEAIETAINNTLNDAKGRWLLASSHDQSKTEFGLLSTMGGKVKQKIIDRSFMDETGIVWIVDYKTSLPRQDETRQAFIDREVEQYRYQLLDYKFHYALLYNKTVSIKTALYFTHYPLWHEVEL